MDLDFEFPTGGVCRYRSPEVWSTPYDAKSGLAKIIEQAPVFCRQSANAEDATGYGIDGDSFVSMGYRSARPTLGNALSYGLGWHDYSLLL